MAYVPIVPYADKTYATAYFAQRLNTSAWDSATETDKDKALAEATRLIDLLPLVGCKYEEGQAREFPRSVDDEGVIDPAVNDACCEVAISLLQGNTLDELAGSLGVSSESVGDASVSYTGERGQMAIVDDSFGLPSPVAASLLAPWIEDPTVIDLTRV